MLVSKPLLTLITALTASALANPMSENSYEASYAGGLLARSFDDEDSVSAQLQRRINCPKGTVARIIAGVATCVAAHENGRASAYKELSERPGGGGGSQAADAKAGASFNAQGSVFGSNYKDNAKPQGEGQGTGTRKSRRAMVLSDDEVDLVLYRRYLESEDNY